MYTVSSSPHIKSNDSVQGIMRDVIIALLPATFAGIYFFGMQAFLVTLVSVLSCIAAEALWQKLTHRKITIGDLSAVVTGLLLAFNLPAAVPLWLPAIGGFFAIIIVKQFFGGIGQNVMNPALAARAFLLASWPVHMTNFTVDGTSAATALGILKTGGDNLPSLMNVFIGNVGGCIGETSVLALLIGGAYLLYRKIISWHTPVVFIGTVFVLTAILGRDGLMTGNALYEICAGGLMIGAFFMATDYSTSPMTKKGQLIFGLGCGVLTTIIRLYGGYAEGVSYSILIMSLFVPFIDKFTAPRIFGEVK
ncbi:RnfABCDGE type electron transport complex subunit D [Clostridium sp. CM028]|uniref:RnfABCDGE type electron transport complex subunit D n=1 Tax=unclassified Clostridium TaxID=2614128 RepID=UPI001C0B491D|nr:MULTISPECIES: RnfABCDGE type electron transport complex subunit D [unclassified Clostridium]MBU3090951.1 RnfABCDGE type electron transport complex subunit D [Clostridium sp. CF011]MBW9144483.1 RnfABCDGE type electron transport complex subunit D [Clostridium sp. CM027]MBW9147986.1 RnfABCDGE type electron transport complex subunit D [Clostridium sp. CM028]UVE40744.1 RnfABCDGE type electron transport complex subunit D [Clostridium sp. CM027]WAG69715.1 RnfABCDGE type electron transport complex 